MKKISHPSLDERRARGKQARTGTPLSAHAGWRPASDRPDPVVLLEEQNTTRVREASGHRAHLRAGLRVDPRT